MSQIGAKLLDMIETSPDNKDALAAALLFRMATSGHGMKLLETTMTFDRLPSDQR